VPFLNLGDDAEAILNVAQKTSERPLAWMPSFSFWEYRQRSFTTACASSNSFSVMIGYDYERV
jgi:hypothetical protein